MKKTLRSLKLACLAAVSMLVVSCGGSADYRNFLPADSFMTMSVNPASLLQKSDAGDIGQHPLFIRLKAELDKAEGITAEEKEYLLALLKNPCESGVDLKKDLFFFMSMDGAMQSPNVRGGMLLPVGDKAKLDALLARIGEKSGIAPRHEGGVSVIALGEDSSVSGLCAYNDVAVMLYFAQGSPESAIDAVKKLFAQKCGESLMGEKQYGIDEKRLAEYAAQIKEIHELGVQIGIVIGGGNIFRGLSGANKGFDRVKGDQMGMLATVINSLALSSALVAAGVKVRVLTAVRMEPIGEFYNKWRAIECMEAGEVVIMSAGTGNPFFTTDTGSSLRGIEIEADVMLKGTRVDGIYTADPEKDPTATKFHEITYGTAGRRGLKVMDLTATCMCKENNLPIIVFDMDTVGNLKKVMQGEEIGTLVHN